MTIVLLLEGLMPEVQSQWLAVLSEHLPHETILLPEQIDAASALDVDIAIVANIRAEALARFPHLVWVQSLWAGVDSMTSEINSHHIKLVRLIDPHLAKTMAESVLAWTLYLQRDMSQYAKQQTKKQWTQLPSKSAKDTTVSVLGAGKLGIAALELLSKLGYQLSCWSRTNKNLAGITHYSGTDGLQTMLGKTDILINLLPLTKDTHRLLDKHLLSLLPIGAQVINFSRGAVVDTDALVALLDTQHLAHAVLDVFETEPLPKSSSIWQHPNITVLPHISAPTNMLTAAKVVADNIQGYRTNNLIPETVDSDKGY
jgi:glyoxylate/hydroxypyruvate reductase A